MREMADNRANATICDCRVAERFVTQIEGATHRRSQIAMIATPNIVSLKGKNALIGKSSKRLSPPNRSTASEDLSNMEELAATPSIGQMTMDTKVIVRKAARFHPAFSFCDGIVERLV